MVFLEDRAKLTMRRGETIPVTIDLAPFLPIGSGFDTVDRTLTRVDPWPETPAPASWRGAIDTAGQTVTQYILANDLSEGYVYRFDYTFSYMTYLETVQQIVSITIEIATATATNIRGVTRQEIRQIAGMGTGDLVLCKATADGTDVQFTDANKLLRPREEYIGRRIYFVSGRNGGSIRRIVAATSGTATVQWSPALSAPTKKDDIAELWSRHELGWEPDDVNRFIRQAHLEATSHFQLAATADISDFSADQPIVAIPSSFVAVTGLEWQDDHSPEWITVDRARTRNGPGYTVDKANRTIMVNGGVRYELPSSHIRIRGYIKERPLDSDGDLTNLNVEWIVARVKELMYNQLTMRTDNINVAMNMAAQFRQEAAMKRTMVVPRRAANVDWIG